MYLFTDLLAPRREAERERADGMGRTQSSSKVVGVSAFLTGEGWRLFCGEPVRGGLMNCSYVVPRARS